MAVRRNHCIYVDAVQTVPVLLTESVDAFQPYLWNGLHGITMQEGVSGDTITFDISARTYQLNVGNLTVNIGTKLYLNTSTKALQTSSTDGHFFGVALTAKNGNSIADVYIVPQHI